MHALGHAFLTAKGTSNARDYNWSAELLSLRELAEAGCRSLAESLRCGTKFSEERAGVSRRLDISDPM